MKTRAPGFGFARLVYALVALLCFSASVGIIVGVAIEPDPVTTLDWVGAFSFATAPAAIGLPAARRCRYWTQRSQAIQIRNANG